MKYLKTAAITAVLAAGLSVAPVSAATIVVPLTPGPGGTLSGGFTQNVLTPTFDDTFQFVLPSDGFVGASLVTIAVNAVTNVDFTSAFLNGNALTLSPTGNFETGNGNFGVMSGLQELRVTGTGGGNGDYSGTISFRQLAAVPEPATWAFMILGFGAIGFAMRRRRKMNVNVSYA